jgi:hypothetical protein
MEFRKGDRISIEATVKHDVSGDDNSYVFYITDEGDHSSSRARFVSIIRRAFQVGDAVQYLVEPGKSYRGKIFAMQGEWLWLDQGDGMMLTAHVDKCVRDAAPAVIAGGNGTWVAPPPNPEDSPPMLGETFVDGLRVTPKLNGIVPPVELMGGYGNEITYTLAEGDTLEAMAYVFGTSVDTICTLNDIRHPATVGPGTVLRVLDNRIPF